MKTIIKSLSIASLLLCSSCEDLTLLNVDVKNATVASGETFFANAQRDLSDHLHSSTYLANGPASGRLFVQQITSVTYLEGVTYVQNFSWDALYRDVLKDFSESAKVISATTPLTAAEEIKKKNQLAIIEIMSVYTYSILVDSYGNIPYSQALDFNNVLPKYDDAKTVYLDLISRLSAATARLDAAGTSFGSADLIYAGNVSKWIKMGNSLKLKLGMRIIDAAPAEAAAAVSAAVTSGVFTSNAANALVTYLPEFPNSNPWWSFLVRQNLKYYVGTDVFVNTMNAVSDPRRTAFFAPVNGQYLGAESGAVSRYESFSALGSRFLVPTLPNIMLDYASVEFLLAEAAERGIANVTNAESHYNAAITASFQYYGVSGIAAYLAQPAVKYTTAAGSWKQKIGTQKWIALFEQGFEAWTEYRRLDFPVLKAPAAAMAAKVPVRFIYPISEQTVNGGSYDAAAKEIGGDLYATRLFWDVQ
ncbi:SusD/RagB family nutrient-binding outer membrane lipoprotein [Dyadobacter psychrotolerans]|uniref:SusD/RagB family nutrient-binding outer membrane lipoprotein n=1 Tax=Dyadobacter psychrotolerans TaxID=2541721 RepID=A0A4R5DRB6_9BACT|nr:SusD/RagB family nutrient-binding outer membrane lipoprotein [Dyadobacter psychrotolerans]TDE14834.1 SusD/RagB family nutrient-binding outer membrane lipoprotein [Dyadobacter psychrotolerans]